MVNDSFTSKDVVAAESEPEKPISVLHLEDDLNDADLIRAALIDDGLVCEVTVVSNRDAFAAALERGGFDLVLSDFSLPTIDGLRALALAKEKSCDVPFILVSGTLGEEAAIDSVRGGATDYVLKHRLKRLAPAMRRALAEAAERRGRQEAEHRSRRSQERFEIISRATNDAVWEYDVATDRSWWSENFQTLFGCSAQEVNQNQAFSVWISRLHPHDRERFAQSFRAVIQNGREVWSAEYRFRRADGTYADVFDRGSLIRDIQDRPVRMIGAMMDVTERKQLEERFRQAQKMEAVGRLAGGVAHDFNNLLTAILGYSQLALGRIRPDEPPYPEVKEIVKAGERAAALTRQLLAFSRQQVLQPRVLDLNAVITELEKMLRRLIGSDIEILAAPAVDLGRVKADPGQIEQVILNLVVNARDAMPDGGRLIVETTNVHIDEIRAREHAELPPGPYVMLAVSDTGCGMDTETKTRIFEPFFTTKELGKGTGLGLSTVHGIVKQSGGCIEVQSESGRGTTFRIYLPRVDEALEAVKLSSRYLKSVHGTETVLVVDDEELVRAVIRETLSRKGYVVLEARDGVEALELCVGNKEVPVDLIVTDLMMPRMSGADLVSRLVHLRPRMRVLYISGNTDKTIAHHGVPDKSMAFLQKPFTPESLLRRVREVLDLPLSDALATSLLVPRQM
jgi:hypothetical protein